MSKKNFLFCSTVALSPPLLRVAEIISAHYNLSGHVIAPRQAPVFTIQHYLTGALSKRDFDPRNTPFTVHFLPPRKGNAARFGFKYSSLKTVLKEIKPDYIWLFLEFWGGIVDQFLWQYRFKRHPKILAEIEINHIEKAIPVLSPRWPFLSRTRLKQIFLWGRLNGVSACATKAMECARRIGLPQNVPVVVNYFPVFGPEEAAKQGISLPWSGDSAFVIGFAGLLSEQKGWKVLFSALELLPEKFKVVIAGDGPQRQELLEWLKKPYLKERVYYTGSLAHSCLLATYPLFDVFILPSITTPSSVEQFGCVLAEAMACGVPVIGSDSGAIPETISEAGIIVPERNPQALAEAIVKISEDKDLRQGLISKGKARYSTYYSCQAYASSLAGMFGLK